jgi:hypothetical protein
MDIYIDASQQVREISSIDFDSSRSKELVAELSVSRLVEDQRQEKSGNSQFLGGGGNKKAENLSGNEKKKLCEELNHRPDNFRGPDHERQRCVRQAASRWSGPKSCYARNKQK